MIKKILIFIVIAIVAALAAKKLMSEKQAIANQKTPLMLQYNIETTYAKQDTLVQKIPFLAQVQSQKEVKIATKLSGTVKKVFVTESQSVKKGDLLVQIDDRVIQTNLKTLLATLEVQKQDIAYYKAVAKRNKKLLKAHAISQEKYDASVLLVLNKKAQRDATKEKINALRSDLTYLKIHAPFDGVIATVFLHEGDLAMAGKPILILNSHKQKLAFSYANTNIKVGGTVLYKNDEIGKVSKIYPNAKNNLDVAEVALFKKTDAKNNSFISIDVVTNKASGCSVPTSALLHTQENTYILVYENNKFSKQPVDVVLEGETKAIITPCTKKQIAVASESKLAVLPFYKNISIVGK